jgi:hypothetical protein
MEDAAMEYTIKTPAVLGNFTSLYGVAMAMAHMRALAGGKGFKKPTYDGALKDFTATLIKAARSGQLQVSDQFGSPDTPDELISIARKDGRLVEIPGNLDLTVAVNIYVNVQQLNTWAAALGHTFSITHDSVPWIDETGWNNVDGAPPELDYQFDLAEPEEIKNKTALLEETKEQRQDRRLKDCESSGLRMPKSAAGRLPDGVGAVADFEGVTRQSFSADVKAALLRRELNAKEGSIVHRT